MQASDEIVDAVIDEAKVIYRADGMSLAFRKLVGLGDEERAYSDARAEAFERPEPMGLTIEDIDLLLQRRSEVRWHEGFTRGVTATSDAMDRQHQAELGEYVGAVCDLVSSDLLAHVVTAAVQARDAKGATRAEIVQAVIVAVKREAGALDELGARARRGELFS